MFRRWLVVDALIFALVFSFAAQICMFSVYGANGAVAGAIVSATGDNGSGGAITDGSGHYTISEGLKTGTYNVSAFASGYVMSGPVNVSVTAGQTISGVDFGLQLSGAVSGMVTDAVNGSALSGIAVYAFSANGSGTFGWYATTGSDGKYAMATNLPTGMYNVSILFPDRHLPQTLVVNVTAGVETKNVNFALARSGIISGKITKPDGTPLKDISVTAFLSSGGFGYYGSATTDAAGNYRIVSWLGTGNYSVSASGEGAYNSTLMWIPPYSVMVTAGQETSGVNLELTPIVPPPPTPSGTIKGRVTDMSDGHPITDASVTATGDNGFGFNSTDSNGYYVISSGLEDGIYDVTAKASGYQDQTVVSISVTVNQTTSDVDLQMTKIPPEQYGTITGTVTGAPNAIPEFQYPIAVALSLTLVAAAAGRLFLRTKRFKNARSFG